MAAYSKQAAIFFVCFLNDMIKRNLSAWSDDQ